MHIPLTLCAKTISLIYQPIIATCLLCITVGSQALSPEFEADRLLLLAQEEVDHKRFAEAEQTLNQIQLLEVSPPTEYYYIRGLVLATNHRPSEAISSLEQYIESSGKEAKHYHSALQLITDQKKQLPKNSALRESEDSKANIQWSDHAELQSRYTDHIKYLYQIDDTTSALVKHANNLLDTFTPSSNKRFALSFEHQGKLVTTTKSVNTTGEQIISNALVVYGINPYIDYSCPSGTAVCTFYHPVNRTPWLELRNNEQAAQELTQALAELIKSIQMGS